MKNKKAAIKIYLMIIGFVMGIALYIMARIYYNPTLLQENFVGDAALVLLTQATLAQGMVFYSDTASQFALYPSLHELARKGGEIQKQCSQFEGITLWDFETCPDKEAIQKDFLTLFDQHFNDALEKPFEGYVIYADYLHPDEFSKKDVYGRTVFTTTKTFPLDNYDYYLEEEDNQLIIHGIATVPLQLPLVKLTKNLPESRGWFSREVNKVKEANSFAGIYEIKPSFSHTLDYSFEQYDTVQDKILALKQTILDAETGCDLTLPNLICPEKKINDYAAQDSNFTYILGCEEYGQLFSKMTEAKTLVLCVNDLNHKFLLYEDNELKYEPLTYRFAFSLE
jgi:hypothetical protein